MSNYKGASRKLPSKVYYGSAIVFPYIKMAIEGALDGELFREVQRSEREVLRKV